MPLGFWLRRLYRSTAQWFGLCRRPLRRKPQTCADAGLEFELLEKRTLPTVSVGAGLLGQYYNDETLTHLVATRTDPIINFGWGSGSPIAGLTGQKYSVRWTGQLQALTTGPITFYTNSDDGVRVILNGNTIINDWTVHPARTDTSTPLPLVAGQKYSIEVDFFQHFGTSVMQLFWSDASHAKQIVPTGQLFPTATSAPPPITPGTTPDWFSLHLLDPTLRNQARSLDSDGSLNRSDMLSLFSTAGAGGVSSNKYNDLRTLLSNAGYLHMPDYVANLANKVVNSDPANATYQGQPLGDLHPGSSSAQLQNLVNKWFLGKDHPAIPQTVTARDVTGHDNTYTINYTLTAGNLFAPSGPNYADIKQGQVADCYFVAAIAEIAKTSPQAIHNAFIDNGDGTYTVRFLNSGVADYVTVDRYLPTYVTARSTQPKLWYAGMTWLASNPSNILWAPLIEKAYVQIAASGWTRGNGSLNAYSTITNGWEGTVLGQIAGRSASSSAIVNSPSVLNSIVTKFQAGQMVALDSNNTTAFVVPNHVYVVVGYNPIGRFFDVYNVWGYHQFLSWSQITANFFAYSFTL